MNWIEPTVENTNYNFNHHYQQHILQGIDYPRLLPSYWVFDSPSFPWSTYLSSAGWYV